MIVHYKRRRSWKMKIKKVGSHSPPIKRFKECWRVVFLTSLGSVGRLKGNWCNYPTGSPKEQRLGTLQGELSFWKGQKREPQELVL